jgi:protein-L-isoaspartate(D-aspartate) O-methyltransferase
VRIGAGSGYYTAILAHLIGPDGRVFAYAIDESLAARHGKNLREQRQVEVLHAIAHRAGPSGLRMHDLK